MTLDEKLNKYLDSHITRKKQLFEWITRKSKNILRKNIFEDELADYSEIDNYIESSKEKNTFQTKLFNYIDERKLTDPEVYNNVGIDRRLFSKIRSNKDYHPSKETVILLGVSLKLTEDEIEDLLESASYSLPKNNTFDLIIRFCFKEKIYNLRKINEFLFDHNCKLLN